jgi:glycosyltransferase involved in cell wall biosynthesis
LPDSRAPGAAVAPGERYKQLLFINEYPPSTVAGAPVTARQLFRSYDPEKMDVICCASWYESASQQVRETFLPCRHTVIPTWRTRLRPRRIFAPIEATLDSLRIGAIMQAARRIVRERRVEVLFTTSYGAEMPHAAYFLARELGLPLEYFEMDRLDRVFTCRRAKKLILENRQPFLESVDKLWLISPAMVREFKKAFGVDGEVLFNFVDVERSQRVVATAAPLPKDRIRLVYTGSINLMFYDAMRWFCELLNRGLAVDGRPVELVIYSSSCPPELLGKNVSFAGLVKSEEIPEKLAQAHVAVMLVSFTNDPAVRGQIETSVYTKTVDYLAASRPVLLVAPPYAGQVDAFGEFSCMLNRLDEAALVVALRRLVDDQIYVADLQARGLARARAEHSLEALDRRFLSHLRVPA